MRIPTLASERPLRPPPAVDRPAGSLPAILAAAAAYALAELLAGLLIGRFFSGGRAEALLFFALRPWLLLAAALFVARLTLRRRIAFYGAALLLASISQSLFLVALGAANPVPEAARGLFAGAALILPVDLLIQLGRRFLGRAGVALAAAAAVMLFLLPGALRPYESLVMGGRGYAEAPEKPDLMLLSALPLVWGELGPLDQSSQPAEVYQALQREFTIRPLDRLDRLSLAGGRLLLVAQPRALAPAEFVALDDWIRGGGRALILADPLLLWPSELPLGDIRRPPAIGLLAPILDHWGLRIDPPAELRAVAEMLETKDVRRRLVMFAPGRLEPASRQCSVAAAGVLADYRLGKGRAIVLSDADMLHDRMWMGLAGAGSERHTRISDNPLIVADQLDALLGRQRERLAGSVQWLDPAADRRVAILLALLPLLLAATPATYGLLRPRS
jgi:hypothetical protein